MFIFLISNTVFVIFQGDNNNHAENNDCMMKKECAEELNQECARTTNKKKIDSRNRRTKSSEKANMVAFHPTRIDPRELGKHQTD